MLTLQHCRTTDLAQPWRWVVRELPQSVAVAWLDDDLAAALGGQDGPADQAALGALVLDEAPCQEAADALDDAQRCYIRALRRARLGDAEYARECAIRVAIEVQAVREIAALHRRGA